MKVAILGAALVVLTAIAFAGVAANGFLNFDDRLYVTANAQVLKGVTPQSVTWAFTTFHAANWHPVTWLSHMVDIDAFGLAPGRHHLVSLVLHAANAVLLFLLLIRMTGAVWRPSLAAALFAIHPLHVESVAWVAERKDVLSTLFWLLTLFAWLHYLDSKTAARYVLVVILFALGLMSKPMLVTLPLTLMLLDYWPLRRTTRAPLIREKAPLLAMAAASAVVTFIAQKSGGAVQSLEKFDASVRIANAAMSYVWYLGKTVWPSSLACFYPFPGTVGAPALLGSLLILTIVTTLAVIARRKAPYAAFGWSWYLVTLVPVIGLIQVGAQARADRYTYVPLIGVFVALAWGLGELAERSQLSRRVIASGAVVAVVALTAVTRAQVAIWAGSESLCLHALAVTADNWTAHNNLGAFYAEEGRKDDAIVQFEEVVRMRPGLAKGHYNLAVALKRSDRLPEAIAAYGEAIRLKPDFVEAYVNLGVALTAAGRDEDAAKAFARAEQLRGGAGVP